MTSSSYCPPVSPAYGGLFGAWLEGWSAAVAGSADLFAASLERFPRALDVPRWLEVYNDRRPPQWATEHSVVFEAPVARLRDYSVSGAPRGLVPTLVLPPQAGHDSCIVDFSPEQIADGLYSRGRAQARVHPGLGGRHPARPPGRRSTTTST